MEPGFCVFKLAKDNLIIVYTFSNPQACLPRLSNWKIEKHFYIGKKSYIVFWQKRFWKNENLE